MKTCPQNTLDFYLHFSQNIKETLWKSITNHQEYLLQLNGWKKKWSFLAFENYEEKLVKIRRPQGT